MKIKIFLSLVIFFFFLPLLCEVRVTTDETILLPLQEISAFRAKIINNDNLLVEVVIYSYSTKREVYSLDESGALKMKNEAGFIRCMVTVSGEARKKEVFFVEANGEERESLFSDAAEKINAVLSRKKSAKRNDKRADNAGIPVLALLR